MYKKMASRFLKGGGGRGEYTYYYLEIGTYQRLSFKSPLVNIQKYESNSVKLLSSNPNLSKKM